MKYSQNYSIEKQTLAGVAPVSFTQDGYHIVFSVHADAATTATIKILASGQDQAPDFSAASSSTNDWGYIAFRDLATSNLIAGATGITITTTTHHKVYEIESNVMNHIAFQLTSVSGDGISFNVIVKG